MNKDTVQRLKEDPLPWKHIKWGDPNYYVEPVGNPLPPSFYRNRAAMFWITWGILGAVILFFVTVALVKFIRNSMREKKLRKEKEAKLKAEKAASAKPQVPPPADT